MRPHVAAVCAYARRADDIADEGTAPAADRLERLDAWQRRLGAAMAAERSAEPPRDRDDLIVAALAHSIRSLDLPIALFDDLLSAFGQDTMTKRYGSWSDVLDYCRRSANPIGRLVLRIGGYRHDDLDRSSDALCTALQLANHWQDVTIDLRRGRIYLPEDALRRFGVTESDLQSGRATEAFRALMRDRVARTRALFAPGRSLCDAVRGRFRGDRVRARLERRRHDEIGILHLRLSSREIGDARRLSSSRKLVRLVNERGIQDVDGDGYYIRSGIIIVPKGGVVKPGTVV